MLTATVGCKGKTSVSPGGEEPTDTIRVEPLDLGSDFNPAYYPVKEKITQREGKIDVVIVFNGLQPGWRALAKEYERLHSGPLPSSYTKTTILRRLIKTRLLTR